jgi:hypothetical protein
MSFFLSSGHKTWAQVSGEDFGVHGAFDEEGSRQAVAAKCGNEGRSLPMTVRHGCHAALVLQRAAVKAGHLRVEPGLVNEDQPRAVPNGAGACASAYARL